MMDRQTVELGFVVRQSLGDAFTTADLGGRLALQRAIYLLQACGAYMGYPFTWYLRGPYCVVLAAQGFELRHIYNEIPDEPVEFADRAAQASFKKFLGLARGKGAGDMDALALLHYTRRNRPDLGDDGVRAAVLGGNGCHLTEGQVSRMWKQLADRGLVGDGKRGRWPRLR